jgi:hypothetical protein
MTNRMKLALGAVVVIATFVVGMPWAHAGAGMGEGAGATTCRTISQAPNQARTFNVTDPVTAADEVGIATAALLCDLPATGTLTGGEVTGGPPPLPNAVTCYAVRQADQARMNVTITDAFGVQTVRLGGIHLVCVPSTFAPAP